MSKSEVGGNAEETGRVLVLAFSRGGEVAAQMAAQPNSKHIGPGGPGSRRVSLWQEALEVGSRPSFSLGLVGSGSSVSQEGAVSGREPVVESRKDPDSLIPEIHGAPSLCEPPGNFPQLRGSCLYLGT